MLLAMLSVRRVGAEEVATLTRQQLLCWWRRACGLLWRVTWLWRQKDELLGVNRCQGRCTSNHWYAKKEKV